MEFHRFIFKQNSLYFVCFLWIASLKAAQLKRNRYQKVASVGAISQDQFAEAQLAVSHYEAAVEAQKQTIERKNKQLGGYNKQ